VLIAVSLQLKETLGNSLLYNDVHQLATDSSTTAIVTIILISVINNNMFNQPIFYSYAKLGPSPKVNFWN